jgi:hypothetical protein
MNIGIQDSVSSSETISAEHTGPGFRRGDGGVRVCNGIPVPVRVRPNPLAARLEERCQLAAIRCPGRQVEFFLPDTGDKRTLGRLKQ